MQWFKENFGSSPSGLVDPRYKAQDFGKRHFSSSYARGGLAATIFAPTTGEALKSPWRRTHKPGSTQHIANLRKMQMQYPGNKKIAKALVSAEQGAAKAGMLGKLGKVAGPAMSAAFVVAPAFTTPGGPYEKGKAMISGAAGLVGFEIGSKAGLGAGAAAGAALGAFLGPVGAVAGGLIGGAVGFFGGGLAGSAALSGATDATFATADQAVQNERNRRQLGWVGDQTAFMTEGAHTMRQQSLQAMNRGMMSARSMLGKEGMMLHQ